MCHFERKTASENKITTQAALCTTQHGTARHSCMALSESDKKSHRAGTHPHSLLILASSKTLQRSLATSPQGHFGVQFKIKIQTSEFGWDIISRMRYYDQLQLQLTRQQLFLPILEPVRDSQRLSPNETRTWYFLVNPSTLASKPRLISPTNCYKQCLRIRRYYLEEHFQLILSPAANTEICITDVLKRQSTIKTDETDTCS